MRPEATKRPIRRGFSLIEILIAVIILALGLLGLGAVFPVVIREQKIAQDRISGTLAENNVRSVLRGIDKLNQPWFYSFTQDNTNRFTGEVVGHYTGWATLKEDWVYHEAVNDFLTNPAGQDEPDFVTTHQFSFSREGLWETFWGTNQQAPNADNDYAQSGEIVFVDRDDDVVAEEVEFPVRVVDELKDLLSQYVPSPPRSYKRSFTEFRIPLSQRINPAGDPGDETPTHVWDFVVRRKLETSDPRALQVAVFIRRVDPRLRPIPRQSPTAGNTEISITEQIFNPSLPLASRRLPVGEDNSGLPTLDGTDGAGGVFYSGVHTVIAYFQADPSDPLFRKRDRIWVTGGLNSDIALVRQPGQRIIDNLGNIYTVVGVDGPFLKVDPPVPPSVLNTLGDPTETSIRQLAFTPQIPVAAFVVEIEP